MSKAPSQGLRAPKTKIEGHLKPRGGAGKPRDPKQAARVRDLARIHALKRELRLDDDTYRDVLWAVCRVESSASLDDFGRGQLIAHLVSKLPARKTYPGRPANTDAQHQHDLKKIEALLTDAGKPWAYALAILKQQTGGRKTRLEFSSPAERQGVIAALHRAALKRLHAELEQEFGVQWASHAMRIAALGFGFDGFRCDITRYPQPLSQVLRYQRGQLAPVCQHPVPADWRAVSPRSSGAQPVRPRAPAPTVPGTVSPADQDMRCCYGCSERVVALLLQARQA